MEQDLYSLQYFITQINSVHSVKTETSGTDRFWGVCDYTTCESGSEATPRSQPCTSKWPIRLSYAGATVLCKSCRVPSATIFPQRHAAILGTLQRTRLPTHVETHGGICALLDNMGFYEGQKQLMGLARGALAHLGAVLALQQRGLEQVGLWSH